ncbi:MAG: O-antigen ligase family protein [Candidatus Magasanikbacteria bacterium]
MREKYIKMFILLLLIVSFFVPLIVVPSHFIFPFIVPKIVVLRSIILLMFGAYIILALSNWAKYKPQIASVISVSVMIFLASKIFSTFIGVDWYRSLWDNHERMLGAFTLIHYVLYYLIITSVFKTKEEWKLFLRFFLSAGLVVLVIGFIQYFNRDFLLNRGSDRVSSTLGNPIYYGGYALFLLFVAALLGAWETHRAWKIYALIGIVFSIVAIFLSGTRGTMLGFFASVLTVFVLYLVSSKNRRLSKIMALVFFCLVIVGGLSFLFRESAVVKGIPGFGRLLNTSITRDSADTRIMAWEIAIEAWKEKPVFGWGPTNYYYAFNKYYHPAFLRHGYGETWFDNAHNAVLNILAEQGLIGIISYLALFIVPFGVLIMQYKRGNGDRYVLIYGVSFLGAHFVHNFFVFENLTSYLYFFFFLAMINSMARQGILDKEYKAKYISWGTLGLVFAGVLLLVYSTDINPARANIATVDLLRNFQANNGATLREDLEKIKNISSPHIDDIRADVARVTGSGISASKTVENTESAKQVVDFVMDLLEQNRQLHPMDIRYHLQMAQTAQDGARLTQNLSYLLTAENILTEAQQYSPKRQQIRYFLSVIKIQLGKVDEAFALVDQTIQDEPLVQEGWWRKAVYLKETGKITEAKELLREAEAQGVNFHSEGKQVRDAILNLPEIMIETEPVTE